MAQSVSEINVFPSIKPINQPLFRQDEVMGEFLKILKWCFIPIIFFAFYWFAETYILQSKERLVPNPAEFPCRIFGFAHYTVGMMFMLSSKKMRKIDGWLWFIGLLGVGVSIAILFYNFGGKFNPVMVIFYFLFFMVHGFRDMVFFYQPSSENLALERTRTWLLALSQACILLVLMYILVPAFFLYLTWRNKTYSPELKANIDALMPYLNGVLMSSWILLLLALVGLRHFLKKYPGGLSGFWSGNKPILLVLIYTAVIILASPLVGPWTYNLLILSHFVGWYFFASRRLETIPKQATPQDGLWTWVRSSVNGFQSLHLGLAAVFFVILLVNHYLLPATGVVSLVLDGNAFYYWTVIHVTISFAPRN